MAAVPPNRRDTVSVDAAVVGAGLVGAALACALADRGLTTAVIDRLDPSALTDESFDGRASAVALSGQRFLAAIGVWEHVASRAEPIREIRVSDNAAPLFLHYDHAEIGGDFLGMMVENRHLRAAFAARVRELAPRLIAIAPANVARMDQTADHASLELADGRSVRAAVVIASEGRDSSLRDRAGIGLTGWTYPQVAIVATIGHERPHRGIAHECFLPAGPFAILPLPDAAGIHRSSLVWTERAAAAASYLALSDDAFLAEIDERVGGFLGGLSLIGPRFSHPLGLQFAATYVQGRLVLAGDSAHGIHPIAGQGLNLGLRDAAALTDVLVEARRLGLDLASPDGLARYERWRRADNLLMAAVTDALNRLFSNDNAPLRLVRGLGLGLVNRLTPARRTLMRHAMGILGDLPALMRPKLP